MDAGHVGQVDVQRRDRDPPRLDGPQVRPLGMFLLLAAETHPVVVAPAQVGASHRVHLAHVAEPLRRHLDLLDPFRRQIGEVQVHHHPIGPFLVQQLGDDGRRERLGRLPVGHHLVVEPLQALAQSDGADAEGHALKRARHRARIADVLADIMPPVHAGQHQVRPLRHQVVDRQDDAVGRRPRHREPPLAVPMHPQRLAQGDAPALGRLFDGGGAHPDVVAQRSRNPLKGFKTFRLDPVVVCQEDSHAISPPWGETGARSAPEGGQAEPARGRQAPSTASRSPSPNGGGLSAHMGQTSHIGLQHRRHRDPPVVLLVVLHDRHQGPADRQP
ncbi:hypothetical protein BREV_BREV_03539 [Brevundimonas mediterranea]|uniref:Uncharacterized protein n=1 Tax=Brevundimonas mediterranea TaxID=74329 RepID=A0A7Z9C5W0_9CAUL|nr:hypothetical protein BREV_BREV_03539 [Brevundimonas mediterranea]